jgi:hypothetical protein
VTAEVKATGATAEVATTRRGRLWREAVGVWGPSNVRNPLLHSSYCTAPLWYELYLSSQILVGVRRFPRNPQCQSQRPWLCHKSYHTAHYPAAAVRIATAYC